MAVPDSIDATLEAKAHELIGQLHNPGKLAAVVHLLEVMVNEGGGCATPEPVNSEPVSEEDCRRFREGQTFFANGKGIPMTEVLADFGLRVEDFPLSK